MRLNVKSKAKKDGVQVKQGPPVVRSSVKSPNNVAGNKADEIVAPELVSPSKEQM